MVRVASLFSQLLTLLPRTEFHAAVKQHEDERNARCFTCWEQSVAMMFSQAAQAKLLREICSGLACCLGKLRHLSVKAAPKKSTLAYANEHRPWELYEAVFMQLLGKRQRLAMGRKKFRFRNKLYSFDSTVIDLCLSLFDWARFRRTNGANKLNLLLNHEGYLPCFGVVSEAKMHDVKMAWALDLPPDSVVVLDRAYNDYHLFGCWTEEGVWFVTRLKNNSAYRAVERRPVVEGSGGICDQVIELTSAEARVVCPHRLRRVKYHDAETGQTLVFLTNHMGFAASTIARIYKDRWQVELFFKALKQNLKVKTFVGTSFNAVKVQIWTALIAMLVPKCLQFSRRLNWALSNLVALVRLNLFSDWNLWGWLDESFETPLLGPPVEQLALEFG